MCCEAITVYRIKALEYARMIILTRSAAANTVRVEYKKVVNTQQFTGMYCSYSCIAALEVQTTSLSSSLVPSRLVGRASVEYRSFVHC